MSAHCKIAQIPACELSVPEQTAESGKLTSLPWLPKTVNLKSLIHLEKTRFAGGKAARQLS